MLVHQLNQHPHAKRPTSSFVEVFLKENTFFCMFNRTLWRCDGKKERLSWKDYNLTNPNNCTQMNQLYGVSRMMEELIDLVKELVTENDTAI